MKPTLLIVEDDPKIAALVAKKLGAAGYDTSVVHDGDAAIAAFDRIAPALVVLDLGLPDTSGFEIARHVRAMGATPVLILSARSSESDKVLGLELGADDYLTKPFGTSELVARVRALLRRTPASTERALMIGPFVIDPARREVVKAGVALEVTTLEFDLVHFLAARAGQVFTRDALMEHVWGSDRVVGERSIDNLMSRLRKKIEDDPDHPRWLQTVWGAGYRFADARA